jgi:hypothetical protein
MNPVCSELTLKGILARETTMADQEKSDEQEGFRVVDRRREGRGDGEGEAAEVVKPEARATDQDQRASREKESPAQEPEKKVGLGQSDSTEQMPQTIDFSQFILSLATSVYIHLGLAPSPDGQQVEQNLMLAKQTIDILSMLEAKTKGNREAKEEHLLTNVLSDIRMRYVEAKKKEAT